MPHKNMMTWELIEGVQSPIVDTPLAFAMPNKNQLGFFGGFLEAPDITGTTMPFANEFFNSLWIYDVDSETWTEHVVSQEDGPSTRGFTCGGYHEDTDSLYVFGGSTYANDFGFFSGVPFVFFDEMWRYEFGTESWTLLDTGDVKPSKRAASGCALVDDELYLFSGNVFDFSQVNDLWKFDVHSAAWTLVEENNAAELGNGSDPPTRPLDRIQSNMATIPGTDKFVVLGGETFQGGALENPTVLDDVWMYDVKVGEWEQLETTNQPDIAGEFQGFAVLSKEYLLTQNGDAQGALTPADTCPPPMVCFTAATPTDRSWFYDLKREKWMEQPAISTGIVETKRSAMVLLDDTLYLWGGYDWMLEPELVGKVPNSNMYKLKLSRKFRGKKGGKRG